MTWLRTGTVWSVYATEYDEKATITFHDGDGKPNGHMLLGLRAGHGLRAGDQVTVSVSNVPVGAPA